MHLYGNNKKDKKKNANEIQYLYIILSLSDRIATALMANQRLHCFPSLLCKHVQHSNQHPLVVFVSVVVAVVAVVVVVLVVTLTHP